MRVFERVNTFFVELLLAIFFFGICAAVLTNIFWNAHSLATYSNRQNAAVLTASSYIEEVKAAIGRTESLEALGERLPPKEQFYGEDWQLLDSQTGSEADFFLLCQQTSETSETGTLLTFVVTVSEADGDELCTLSAKRYLPE